jgi:CBS domain-containing protein
MLLKEILANKGNAVFTIGPHESLKTAVAKMTAHNCGSLVVCENDYMVGVISERDVLRAIAEQGESLDGISVESRMLKKIISGLPSDEIGQTMGTMTEQRIRHMPVMDNGKLCGLISIGDLLKAQYEALALENHLLLTYIQT